MGQKYESELKTDNGNKDDAINTSALMKDLIGTSGLQKAMEQAVRVSMPAMQTSSLMKDLVGTSGLQKAMEQVVRVSMPAMQTSSLMKDMLGTSAMQKEMSQLARLSATVASTSQIASQINWNIPNSLGDFEKVGEELSIFQNNITSVSRRIRNLPVDKINLDIDKCVDTYIEKNKIDRFEEIEEIRNSDTIAELKEIMESSKIAYLPEQMVHMSSMVLELQTQIRDLAEAQNNKKHKSWLKVFLFMIINFIVMNIGSAIGDEFIQEPTKAVIRKVKEHIGEQIKERTQSKKVEDNINLIIKNQCNIRNGHRLKSKVVSRAHFGEIVIKVGKYRRWSKVVFFNAFGEQEIGWIQNCYLAKIQKD
ncbi:MAG: SH3 domain-containing protein [Zhenhengia sp.]|uniref:SH3 domain-containing protein n=1 Tax=Zhenhengia sp. TaxID=2944208 RepID=UPI0039955E00